MRTWTLVLVAAVAVACSGKDGKEIGSDMRADLELASNAENLPLASTADAASGAGVVGAIEMAERRTPQVAPASRAPRPRRSPAPPIQAELVEDPEPQYDVAVEHGTPTPVEDRGFDGMGQSAIPAPAESPSQQPAERGTAEREGNGSAVGAILAGAAIGAAIGVASGRGAGRGAVQGGLMGAILRGGIRVGDPCPPPRRSGPYALPNRSAGGGQVTTIRGIRIASH